MVSAMPAASRYPSPSLEIDDVTSSTATWGESGSAKSGFRVAA
jgi:hypothetical protein